MRKGSDQRRKYYFSERLKRELGKIPYYPLTVVEAPSGFGKTTAVREYLKDNLSDGVREYWYTCLGEPAFSAWMSICGLFANIDSQTAVNLKNLKMPTMDTLFYMEKYLRNIRCEAETYLVVDNYQLVNCDIHRELISVLSMHGNPDLHLIFITQQLKAGELISVHNNNVHTIGTSSFFFDRQGTASLFRIEGIRITEDEAEKVFMSTEGWVSAIRLQMLNFMETGSFNYGVDLWQLVENAIWKHLEPEEKKLLLSVSVLDSFTLCQAAAMIDQDILSKKLQEFLNNNDFIRFLPDKSLYSIHSILRDYLKNRFFQMPGNYKNQIYHKAGQACAADAQYYPAAEFFYKTRDFDAILSLPFCLEYLDNQRDKYQPEFIEALVNECPEDTLCRYPFTMLVFGYQTFAYGQVEIYQKLLRLLRLTVQGDQGFNREEIQRIDGETRLLASMIKFNEADKMHEEQLEACRILNTQSRLIKANTPWFFATTSPLNMFWRESGKLEEELLQIEEFSAPYYKLTNKHGAGYHYLMRAEAMLCRGEDDKAEILCYKALYEARSYKQTDICISTQLILARIAILRGDVKGYFCAVKEIGNYSKESSNLYILRMTEYCMSVISLVLDIKDYFAPWVYHMESLKKALYAPVIPHARVLHLKLLLMEKRYNEFYGVGQCALDTSGGSDGNAKYMMPLVYQLIYFAIAKRNNGEPEEAQEYLKEALDIALPDQIYLPFAQEECMGEFLSEMTLCSYKGTNATNHIHRTPPSWKPSNPCHTPSEAVNGASGGG